MGLRLQTIAAQGYRTISQERQSFAEGQVKEFKLPTDTTIKRFVLRVHGYFKITYSSAPTFDEAGFLGRILSLIQVSDGNDTFKNIDPVHARRMAHLVRGVPPKRRYATGAAIQYVATADASIAGAPLSPPTSTHYIYIDEELPIEIEDPMAYGFGKQATLWSTKGNNACRVRVICGSLSNLAEAGAGGDATYSEINLNMDLSFVEVPHIDENPKAPFLSVHEALYNLQIPVGSTAYGFELPKSKGKLLNMSLAVRNSATAKKFSDTAVKKVRVVGNNSRNFLEANWMDLQGMNKQAFGPGDDQMTSGRHPLQGFALANFIQDGNIQEYGIPMDELSNLIVNFDTSGSSDNPAESGSTIGVTLAVRELRQRVR